MKFKRSTVTVSKGRVSSARRGDSGIKFVIDSDGALVEKTVPKGSKQIVFTSVGTVSYADDCFILNNGKLERRGGYTYVPD